MVLCVSKNWILLLLLLKQDHFFSNLSVVRLNSAIYFSCLQYCTIDDSHLTNNGNLEDCLLLYSICFILIIIQFKALFCDPLNPNSIFSFVNFTLKPVFCKIHLSSWDHNNRLNWHSQNKWTIVSGYAWQKEHSILSTILILNKRSLVYKILLSNLYWNHLKSMSLEHLNPTKEYSRQIFLSKSNDRLHFTKLLCSVLTSANSME